MLNHMNTLRDFMTEQEWKHYQDLRELLKNARTIRQAGIVKNNIDLLLIHVKKDSQKTVHSMGTESITVKNIMTEPEWKHYQCLRSELLNSMSRRQAYKLKLSINHLINNIKIKYKKLK